MNKNAKTICDAHDDSCVNCPIRPDCVTQAGDTRAIWTDRINDAADLFMAKPENQPEE
jgi:hypothetical protein